MLRAGVRADGEAPAQPHDTMQPALISTSAAITLVAHQPASDRKAWAARLGAIALIAISLLGLALRLLDAADWIYFHPNIAKCLKGDEPGYDQLARALLQGEGFLWSHRVPLYPLWLAAIYAITKTSYYAVIYAQAFVGALVVPLTYLIGKRAAGSTAGLLAATGAACSYVLIRQTHLFLSEILFMPVMLLAVLTLQLAIDRPRWQMFVASAVCVGIANLIRPTLFLFVPAIVVILVIARLPWRDVLRYSCTYVAISSTVILPWMVHNYIRWHAVLPLATSHAMIWQASPEYDALIHEQGMRFGQIWDDVLYKAGPDWHDPRTVEGDRWWNARGIASIKAAPLAYLRCCMTRSAWFWIGDPGPDWNDTHPLNYAYLRSWPLTANQATQLIVSRLLIIPALIGAWFLRCRWRSMLAMYSIVLFCWALHSATHAEARYSEPLLPFLLIIISGAGCSVMGAARARARDESELTSTAPQRMFTPTRDAVKEAA
jgi:4-amino-4-deoxy-L-arabinose transferase-like glycosyltransferase